MRGYVVRKRDRYYAVIYEGGIAHPAAGSRVRPPPWSAPG
jgi:hypothetical protein